MLTRNVLLVDDNALIGWALYRALAHQDLLVHVTETGKEAISCVSSDAYGLVILDVHLPDMDGWEVLTAIRSISPKTRVIVFSTDGTEATRRKFLSSEVLGYLEKPFEMSAVLDIVKHIYGSDRGKRTEARRICRAPVRFTILPVVRNGNASTGDEPTGTTIDIGRGGLRMYTEHPLLAGLDVRLTIDPPDSRFFLNLPSDVIAEVRWVKPSGAGVLAGLRYTGSPGMQPGKGAFIPDRTS